MNEVLVLVLVFLKVDNSLVRGEIVGVAPAAPYACQAMGAIYIREHPVPDTAFPFTLCVDTSELKLAEVAKALSF